SVFLVMERFFARCPKVVGTAPNPADVEDGSDQVGNLESAVEPMPTFTSVNPAPCWVGPPRLGLYRSRPSQGNQKRRRSVDVHSLIHAVLCDCSPKVALGKSDWPFDLRLGAFAFFLRRGPTLATVCHWKVGPSPRVER